MVFLSPPKALRFSNFSKALAPTIRSDVTRLRNRELCGDLPGCQSRFRKWEVIGSVWKMASASHIFSSLHANSPRHNLSLEISGERQGAGAVQMVQLQLLSFCKLLGGKASMVRLQGVGELVKQTRNWGRPLTPSNATLLKLMELRDKTH